MLFFMQKHWRKMFGVLYAEVRKGENLYYALCLYIFMFYAREITGENVDVDDWLCLLFKWL